MSDEGALSLREPDSVAAEESFQGGSDPKADLYERGYHLARGLLDPDEVLALRRRMLEEAAEQGWLLPGSAPEAAVPGEPRAHDESDPDDYVPWYRSIQSTEAFHALGRSPRIQALVAEMLGEEVFSLPSKIARTNFPDTRPTAPHQDYYYVQGSVDTVTSWIPLGSCHEGAGRLVVLAGSHRMGPLPPLPSQAGGFWIDTDNLGLSWHGGDYEPGDVLLFHSLTVHAAEENRSGRVRVSVDCRWQPVADPVSTGMLLPHYLRGVAWEELYADWSSAEHQWYWRDLPLNAIDNVRDVEDLKSRAVSRLLPQP